MQLAIVCQDSRIREEPDPRILLSIPLSPALVVVRSDRANGVVNGGEWSVEPSERPDAAANMREGRMVTKMRHVIVTSILKQPAKCIVREVHAKRVIDF